MGGFIWEGDWAIEGVVGEDGARVRLLVTTVYTGFLKQWMVWREGRGSWVVIFGGLVYGWGWGGRGIGCTIFDC